MCEPHHSIVQFEDDDSGGGDLPGGRLGMSLGAIGKWCKKVKGFWNLSRLGKGHSESVADMVKVDGHDLGFRSTFILPDHTDYEVQWWNRVVKEDGLMSSGRFTGPSLESATSYAHLTSIGDIGMLRRFIESSMRNSNNPRNYFERFPLMLNNKGTSELFKKKKRLRRPTRTKMWNMREVESAIKIMCGMTKRRDLLISEWADDSKIWTP